MTRTYSRDDWFRAKQAWTTFAHPLWTEARRAAQAWTIFPPSEEGQDWRDAPHPSQRVIVWFALESRPAQTLDFIRRSSSWSGVIDRIIASEHEIRRGIDWDEETAELERRHERTQYREAMKAVGELLASWRDSVA